MLAIDMKDIHLNAMWYEKMKNMNSLREVVYGKLLKPGNLPDQLLDGLASVSSLRGRYSKLSSIERVITASRFKEPDHVLL